MIIIPLLTVFSVILFCFSFSSISPPSTYKFLFMSVLVTPGNKVFISAIVFLLYLRKSLTLLITGLGNILLFLLKNRSKKIILDLNNLSFK